MGFGRKAETHFFARNITACLQEIALNNSMAQFTSAIMYGYTSLLITSYLNKKTH